MKRRMVEIVARIAYWMGVDAFFYWFNRKAKRIVTFHNVLPDELWSEGVANGVSNRLSDFVRMVNECRKRFPISTNLFDAKTLTVTFDDGYRNQYTTAFKTLHGMGIPAYLFVSGDISEKGCLLIDKLLHWVSLAPTECIPGGDRLCYWIQEVWPRFMADVDGRGENVLRDLESKYPYSQIESQMSADYKRERLTGIAAAELDEMRAAGWQIGWHTKSHYSLAKLDQAALREELSSPLEYRSVCFSYPYGNPTEVGDVAVRLAEELGYPCAVSNTNAAMVSKYFLPRMTLSVNKYLLHFELSGLRYFLKHCKLLPTTKM